MDDPFARRVRTIRMCSLDARGEGPIQAILQGRDEEVRKAILRSRSKNMRVKGGSSNPLCSRNPHDEAVVVRRAQWRITGSRPSKRGVTSKLRRTILMVHRR